MMERPLLPRWPAIADALFAACGGEPDAYGVLLEVAGGMVFNGADDEDEVVSLTSRLLQEPERMATLVAGRAERQAARLREMIARARRHAGGSKSAPASAKRRGSPNATHRSNTRAPGERWDLELEGGEG